MTHPVDQHPESPRSESHSPGARRLVLVALLGCAVLTACAAGPNPGLSATGDLPGFWHGLWHGLISPITFLVSLFNDQVSVYEVRNSGNWYDAGFMGGVSTVFSSTARSGAIRQARRRGRPGEPADRR